MSIRHTVSIRCSIMLVLLFISFGCSHHTQVQNIDLSSAYIADAAITVDDSPKEPAWQRAATMPFEETGKALRRVMPGLVGGFSEAPLVIRFIEN